jgi:hypothetical protein
MAAVVLAVGLAALSAAPAAPVGGETVAVDLGRRAFVVKIAGREPRELDFAVDDATRFTASGRAVRLEDVRPGDRVVVSSMESEGGRRRARLVRTGGARAALASASFARAE